MIQIAFEPAFDPFHTAFRILRQVAANNGQSVEIARAKILDVYVAEPKRCVDIRLPPALKKAARLAALCQPPVYGRRPSVAAFFNRMSPMQDAAIQTLVLQGLLDADAFGVGRIMRAEEPLPARLADRVAEVNATQADLMTFLFKDLDVIAFSGPNGLKDRTQLGEFRYDLV